MRDYEKMTVKELMDELTALGVSFKKKSRKAELIEILKAETEGQASSEKTEESPKMKAEDQPKEKKSPKAKDAAPKEPAKKTKAAPEKPAYTGYAIVRTGGKQYQVSAGSLLRVEKIAGQVGDTIELTEVLVLVDGDKSAIGQPMIEGAVVRAEIVEQGKSKKVLVFKKKRRKGYRVKRGHRQMYTALRISEISA